MGCFGNVLSHNTHGETSEQLYKKQKQVLTGDHYTVGTGVLFLVLQ